MFLFLFLARLIYSIFPSIYLVKIKHSKKFLLHPCKFHTMLSLLHHILLFYFLLPKSSMGFSFHLPFHKHHKPSTPIKLQSSTSFNLPSPIPNWPIGNGFATGVIDLGGLQLTQITSFTKIWSTLQGGPNNQGFTIYEPTTIPTGFVLLGHYAQPNNKPLYGYILVAKPLTKQSLVNPIDYTLIFTTQSLTIKQDSPIYIWLPIPPNGYKPVGHVVTLSSSKPPLDKTRCVHSDFIETSQTSNLIWESNGFNIYSTKLINIGVQNMGIPLGTFTTIAQNNVTSITTCLKNANAKFSYMPNLPQVQALVQEYSPYIYLHPKEEYYPSNVNWFFANGALVYKQGEESNPNQIQLNGTNLPLDGPNDGLYWLDLPRNVQDKERVKKGDLQSAVGYLHIKPMLGGTFTDIVVWVFYPFNGPARAKVGSLKSIPLGKIGEHVGDWEHITLRISNFNGELRSVYFSEHSKGEWLDSSNLEFTNGNKVVSYASLHGHALYPKEGVVMLGNGNSVGIRDDAARSGLVLDVGSRYEVISAEYELGVDEPSWVKYMRKWGPKITYDVGEEISKVAKLLPGKLKSDVVNLVKSLPAEVLGEDGPTGPKVKNSWFGDEA